MRMRLYCAGIDTFYGTIGIHDLCPQGDTVIGNHTDIKGQKWKGPVSLPKTKVSKPKLMHEANCSKQSLQLFCDFTAMTDNYRTNVTYAGMEIDEEGQARLVRVPLYAECKCYRTEITAE